MQQQNANTELANQRMQQNWNQQNAVNAANVQNRNAAQQYGVENQYRKAGAITGQAGNTINPQFAGVGQMIGQAAGNIAGGNWANRNKNTPVGGGTQ